MRWDNLLADPQDSETAKLPLFKDEALIRRLKTPEFAGITFYEVMARSIVNHVPSERFGFNWTINPYRGCSHACSYCMSGDTPILMADGRTKNLRDIRVGDEIYGTVRRGNYRRLVKTNVLDHWHTIKPAYRLTLEDGTTFITSADHRFLTERGWDYVRESEEGVEPRPHLTISSSLVATGACPNEGQAIKNDARLRVSSIEALDVELPLFDISTGTGDFIANGVVSHNCFARPTHTYLDFNGGEDFQTKIVVKVNAVELLRRALRKPSWKGESIAMGTNTDNYQRAEGHYKLMRGILNELNAARNPYSILTKSTLIQRDIDLLAEGASMMDVSTSFSVGTVDEEVWRKTEPGTPHPRKRLEVVRRLNESGIPCGVLMAPILPGISDRPEQLDETVRAIAEAGATHITPLILHLRPGVKEEFMLWLADTYPELVVPYEQMYKRSNAPKDVRDPITKSVANMKARHGRSGKTGGKHRPERSRDKADTDQSAFGGEQTALDLGV